MGCFFAKTHTSKQVVNKFFPGGFHLNWATIKLQVKTSLTEEVSLEKFLVLLWMLRIDITRAWPLGSLEVPSNTRLVYLRRPALTPSERVILSERKPSEMRPVIEAWRLERRQSEFNEGDGERD